MRTERELDTGANAICTAKHIARLETDENLLENMLSLVSESERIDDDPSSYNAIHKGFMYFEELDS